MPRTRSGLSRRAVLGGGAAALAMPYLARAQGGFDWKKFKGEKLEVSLTKGPRGDLLQKYRKEFEDLTGISVGDEQGPEQQDRQKVVIEFTSGNPSFDVLTVSWHVQKRLIGKAKWLEDLRGYLKDPAMTAPDYDYADFAQGAVDYATQGDGRVDT